MSATAASRRRPGMVAAALVVVLLILVLLAGGLVRVVAIRHRDRVAAGRRLQAEWLAESGLGRASSRLESSPGYPGETWTVPASALDGRDGASVRIEVRPVPGRPSSRSIRVRADFPTDEARRARHSVEQTVELPATSPPDRKGDAPR